jgi:hypothetical protein
MSAASLRFIRTQICRRVDIGDLHDDISRDVEPARRLADGLAAEQLDPSGGRVAVLAVQQRGVRPDRAVGEELDRPEPGPVVIPESQDEPARIPPCFSAPASEPAICKNSFTAKEDLEDAVSNHDTPARHGVLHNRFD